MFSYDILIKDVNEEWLPFFEKTKDELYLIINELNSSKTTIYPESSNIFRSLKYFSPKNIKLVILGQDPYINIENNIPQACGLAFSVPESHKKIPPSLLNIFKEIKNCYPNIEISNHGSLERWVNDEKILLLNSALTVEAGKSNSHQLLWTEWSDKLLKFISDINEKTIFLLMGKFAIKKSVLLDNVRHKIFTTPHPSPLSAHTGFFGSNIFKLINNYLEENNKETIKFKS
jgi:uracil-DNA glycosylase